MVPPVLEDLLDDPSELVDLPLLAELFELEPEPAGGLVVELAPVSDVPLLDVPEVVPEVVSDVVLPVESVDVPEVPDVLDELSVVTFVPWIVTLPTPEDNESNCTCLPFFVTVTAVVSPAWMVMESVTT